MSDQNIDSVIPKGCHYYSISLCNVNPVGGWHGIIIFSIFHPYEFECYGAFLSLYNHVIPSGFSRLPVFPIGS
ncbi:MAG: hypothetical protein E3K29_06580 [Candidatus Brocadia sp.]|nr:hypothetical protein [Candidatus Brocadia sp.]